MAAVGAGSAACSDVRWTSCAVSLSFGTAGVGVVMFWHYADFQSTDTQSIAIIEAFLSPLTPNRPPLSSLLTLLFKSVLNEEKTGYLQTHTKELNM